MVISARSFALLIPALIPSWRFFDDIAPSPRIEYCPLENKTAKANEWVEFRPRPEHVSFLQMLGRLFWNPHWNDQLFMVSCAERIARGQTIEHSANEIAQRIRTNIGEDVPFQFRVRFVTRDENMVVFTSEPEAL